MTAVEKMKKVLSIFGTRPEAIKMAPVVKELEQYPDSIVSRVCVTAQHREMLDQVLGLFDITPDYDLDLMLPNQTLSRANSAIFLIHPVRRRFRGIHPNPYIPALRFLG